MYVRTAMNLYFNFAYNDMEAVEWIDEEFLDVSGKNQCYQYLSLNMQ